MDYIQFQTAELDDANLTNASEFEELELEQKKINNFEVLSQKFNELDNLYEHVNEPLKSFQQTLNEINNVDASFSTLSERLESIIIEFDDLKNEIDGQNNLEFADNERQQFVEERLSLLFKLMTKHQVKSLDKLLEIQSNLNNENNNKFVLEERIKNLESEVEKQKTELLEIAKKLNKRRVKTAQLLEIEIISNLVDVGIEHATVKYVIEKNTDLTKTGFDNIELIFSANPGFEAKPLRENASGGEISRFMLVVKNILSKKMKTNTIILDEIDTGISGDVASMVADKLEELSDKQQIICITHLPQVASKGNCHFYVQKEQINNQTATNIKLLKDKERIDVIAELLGVKTAGKKAIDNAKELLKM